MSSTYALEDPCKYSFKDLYQAAKKSKLEESDTGFKQSLSDSLEVDMWYASLLLLSQPEINETVKRLCKEAGWYWSDMVEDGVVYTSFSPRLKTTT